MPILISQFILPLTHWVTTDLFYTSVGKESKKEWMYTYN